MPAGAADPSWFQQKLDHFNPQEQRVWPQKYFVNSTFFKTGGPVFFLLGGEGPLSPSSVAGSHFILTQYAQQYNALIVAVEHRFYGDSTPLNDSSTANLRYLTTLQALADFANFRVSLPSQSGMQMLPANATWIVFGGSYSGSLSAWARLKYPHLFHGSLAASAPVHAQTDFPEYFEVVTASIGPACTNAMAAGTVAIEKLLSSSTGRDQLQRYFNTCTPIITDDDAATFMGNLASAVSGVVQYNRDNNNYMPEDMETMCATFLSISDTVQAWINLTNLFAGGACMEVSYDQTIKDLQPSSAGRSWTYQTCTEYGYFQTGELDQQPFSKRITLDYFLRSCKDAFGVALTPDTQWMCVLPLLFDTHVLTLSLQRRGIWRKGHSHVKYFLFQRKCRSLACTRHHHAVHAVNAKQRCCVHRRHGTLCRFVPSKPQGCSRFDSSSQKVHRASRHVAQQRIILVLLCFHFVRKITPIFNKQSQMHTLNKVTHNPE